MSNRIICFGDSWGAGHELYSNQHPFIHWFAEALSMPYINKSVSGSSMGQILHTIISTLPTMTSDDIMLIVIPPDVRWYDENEIDHFYTYIGRDSDEYYNFLNNKSVEWFKYHHAMFIYCIQKILDDVGCKYIMAHNYGQIVDIKKYGLKIDYDHFLSEDSLTVILSDSTDEWHSYPVNSPLKNRFDDDGPQHTYFSGKYFEGCIYHPNETGHKEIARLLLEKYTQISLTNDK